jgi:hypothetical protein
VVAHTIIPATWEVEIRRVEVPGQPRQKVNEIPSQLIKKEAGCGGTRLSSQLLWKCKEDCSWGREMREVEWENSSMKYLTHCKTFVNATVYPQPAQQFKKKSWK